LFKKYRPVLRDILDLREAFATKNSSETERAQKKFLFHCFLDFLSKSGGIVLYNDSYGHAFCSNAISYLVGGDFDNFWSNNQVNIAKSGRSASGGDSKVKRSEVKIPMDSIFKSQYCSLAVLRGFGEFVYDIENRKKGHLQPFYAELVNYMYRRDLFYHGRRQGVKDEVRGHPKSSMRNGLNKLMWLFLEKYDGSLKDRNSKCYKRVVDTKFIVADTFRVYKQENQQRDQSDDEETAQDEQVTFLKKTGVIFYLKGCQTFPNNGLDLKHPCDVRCAHIMDTDFLEHVLLRADSRYGCDWEKRSKNYEFHKVNGVRGLKYWSSNHRSRNGFCDFLPVAQFNDFLQKDLLPALDLMLPKGNTYKIHFTMTLLYSSFKRSDRVLQTPHLDNKSTCLADWHSRGIYQLICMFPLEAEGMILQVFPDGVRDATSNVPPSGTEDNCRNQGQLIYIPYGRMLLFPATLYHAGGIRFSPRGNKRVQITMICSPDQQNAELNPPEVEYVAYRKKQQAITEATRLHEGDPEQNAPYPPDLVNCHVMKPFEATLHDAKKAADKGKKPLLYTESGFSSSVVRDEDKPFVSDVVQDLTDIFFFL